MEVVSISMQCTNLLFLFCNCEPELIFGLWQGSLDVRNQYIVTLTFCIHLY